uniref:Putative proline-rich receptor-like protein kinase perk2 n=1 Tax=Anopheles triannulatus TaxID=58253 RepID=A0A2M4B355_9DIPT
MNWFAALLLFRWSWLLIVLHPLLPEPLPVAALTPAPPLPPLPTTGCPPLAPPLATPLPPPPPPPAPPLPAYAQDSSLLLQLLLDRRFCLE